MLLHLTLMTNSSSYKFLDDSTLLVENNQTKEGKWKISRDGDKILIDIQYLRHFSNSLAGGGKCLKNTLFLGCIPSKRLF